MSGVGCALRSSLPRASSHRNLLGGHRLNTRDYPPQTKSPPIHPPRPPSGAPPGHTRPPRTARPPPAAGRPRASRCSSRSRRRPLARARAAAGPCGRRLPDRAGRGPHRSRCRAPAPPRAGRRCGEVRGVGGGVRGGAGAVGGGCRCWAAARREGGMRERACRECEREGAGATKAKHSNTMQCKAQHSTAQHSKARRPHRASPQRLQAV